LLDLANQQARDQEAGKDEEDVHADVATTQERHLRVVEEHEQYSYGAQSLDVGTKCAVNDLVFGANSRIRCRARSLQIEAPIILGGLPRAGTILTVAPLQPGYPATWAIGTSVFAPHRPGERPGSACGSVAV